MVLRVDGICHLDLRKKGHTVTTSQGHKVTTYFSDFRFQYASDLSQNVHIWQDVGCEAAAEVFAFSPTLTYFCHCDTHLNNGLRPPSAYTALVLV